MTNPLDLLAGPPPSSSLAVGRHEVAGAIDGWPHLAYTNEAHGVANNWRRSRNGMEAFPLLLRPFAGCLS